MYTMVLFIVEDAQILLHYMMHRVPLLWRVHKIHHSATILTPLTFFRIHPIESLLYYGRSSLPQAQLQDYSSGCFEIPSLRGNMVSQQLDFR